MQPDKPPVMEYQRPLVNPYRPFEAFRAGAWCAIVYGGLVVAASAIALYFVRTIAGIGSNARQFAMATSGLLLVLGLGIIISAALASNGKRLGAIVAIVLMAIHMVVVLINLFTGGISIATMGCGSILLVLGLCAIVNLVRALRTPVRL